MTIKHIKSKYILTISFWYFLLPAAMSQVWEPDLGNGQYQNPIIHADYSDPDVTCVNGDCYMVASSFNCAPGVPVLHSRDLVHWKIINHVFDVQPPEDVFAIPQHGNGAWAPAIRYHEGFFYVFYGDPDYGIYMAKTRDPAGAWSGPHLVRAAKGWIDPCPFWDDDGNAYLVHAFAGSRAGIKSILVLHRMAADGSALLDEGVLVFDGHQDHPTIEGPKMYKRKGYYYIFAPGGGVTYGWQTVLRSRSVYGPYEDKVVLHQGTTQINGPHQGAWVAYPEGEDWFLHFQDKGPYGRVVHLQPLQWQDNWPVIGYDADGDGIGEPVEEYRKPGLQRYHQVPQTSDAFDGVHPGRQWQWHANPETEWMFPSVSGGFLRLNAAMVSPEFENYWDVPHLLLQKFPAPAFVATAKVTFYPKQDRDECGLIVMGMEYARLSLEGKGDNVFLTLVQCEDADQGKAERVVESVAVHSAEMHLRVTVLDGGQCQFSYSDDGNTFQDIGAVFQSRKGKWIGAKVGLFCSKYTVTNDSGYADVDWFRITSVE